MEKKGPNWMVEKECQKIKEENNRDKIRKKNPEEIVKTKCE